MSDDGEAASRREHSLRDLGFAEFLPAALAAAVLIFAWPELSLTLRGVPASYAVVTALFAVLVVAIVLVWPRRVGAVSSAAKSSRSVAWLVAVIAVVPLVIATYRWTRLALWHPYGADMLIVIREATRRFLNGRNPYTVYRSYDTTWDMAMPYGPALWAPYAVAQVLRLDFRVLTIVGELFVPSWCAVAAVVEAARGKLTAASWIAVLVALLAAFDVQRFTLIGHTPVYWPWLLLFPMMIVLGWWNAAACLLGILVVARTTMVAIVPVFLMAAWRVDRRRFVAALISLTTTIAALLAPFVVWDHRSLWDSMVLSYPRVMKAAVWPVLARPGTETLGLTEWLLERHAEWLVVPAQIAAMIGVYAAAAAALRRARDPLPWMALALFVFSMTTLYPVHYLYYDVLLLLVSAALAETLGGTAERVLVAWPGTLIALAILVFVAMRAVAPPFPHLAAGQLPADQPFRAGFARRETDGQREFSWIVGHEARIVLPRTSAAAADIVLTAQWPFEQSPQRMAAVLNGTLLTERMIPAGWTEIRIPAPRSAWWVGFNDLRLQFSSATSPRDLGLGADPRPLALGLSRVDVVPR